MSSSRNTKKNQNVSELDTYRQVAPESMTDQSLAELIKSHSGNKEAILEAIQNVWHNLESEASKESEWVTTGKKKDTKSVATSKKSESSSKRGSGSKSSKPKPDQAKPSSTKPTTAAQPAAPAQTQAAESDKQPVSQPWEETPVVAPVKETAAAPGKTTTWGLGGTLAEKLKKQEAEKAVAALIEASKQVEVAAAEDSAEKENASGRKSPSTKAARGGKKKGPKDSKKGGDEAPATSVTEELAANIVELTLAEETASPAAEVAAPLAAAPEAVAEDPIIKLNKWEGEAPAPELNTFQFGTFSATFADDSAPKPQAETNAWGNVAADTLTAPSDISATANVWTSSVESSMNSLFPSKNSIALEPASNAGTRAPPGLEPAATKGNAGNKNAGQMRYNNSAQAPPANVLQQNTYSQPLPPGIPSNAAARNANTGNPAPGMAPGLYPPYNQSFEFQQAGFLNPSFPANQPLSAATNTSPAAAAPASSNAAPSAPATGAAMQQQQQQQQYPYPYYGNPYYGQPFYFGQQVPNYFNQGRGMYQRPPYGADPYGNTPPLYPDMYQQGGQQPFVDSYGAQGTQNKQSNKGNVGASNAPSGQAPADPAAMSNPQGYGYGYNSRGLGMDPQAWPYQPGQTAWPGMMYPTPPGNAPGNPQAFMGQAPGQQAPGSRVDARSGSFGGRGNQGTGGPNERTW